LPAVLLLFRGRLDRLRTAPWISGAILGGLTASSWFVLLGLQEGWESVFAFFLRENVGRYLDTSFGPQRGFFYFPGVFVGDFFPWSIVLLLHVVLQTKPKLKDFFIRGLFPLGWVLLVLIFFSFSLNKQEYYLLPAYPAAALLIAQIVEGGERPGLGARIAAVLTALAAIPLFLLGRLYVPSDLAVVVPVVLLVITARLLWREHLLASALPLSLCFGSAVLLWGPHIEALRPVPQFAEEIVQDAGRRGASDFRAGYFRWTTPSLRFYLDRNIVELYDIDDAGRFLEEPGTRYLVTDEAGYALLRRRIGENLVVVSRHERIMTRARDLWNGLEGGPSGRGTLPVYLVTTRR